MRTNIDIDDGLMTEAMKAGPFSTKKDAVEAGLRLLARQAAYREVLKWEGQLRWEGDESVDWTAPASASSVAARGLPLAAEPVARWRPGIAEGAGEGAAAAASRGRASAPAPAPAARKRRARR